MKLSPLPATCDGEFFSALRSIVDGTQTHAYLPISPDNTRKDQQLCTLMRAGEPIEDAISLVCATSGSTGTPKGAQLTRDNLLASIRGTEEYFHAHYSRQPGPWLLALPAQHIAGIQVCLRSLHAGYEPILLGAKGSFTPQTFITATLELTDTYPDQDYYTSLVSTQLHTLLSAEKNSPTVIDALRTYTGVLVGGSALSDTLAQHAHNAGIHIITTYGASETAGGLVYNGDSLPGASYEITENGQIILQGPQVAQGYRSRKGFSCATTLQEQEGAFPYPHTYKTQDYGSVEKGRLTVHGRIDSAINTGGYKVLPQDVENMLSHVPLAGFDRAVVVGVPHPQWGQSIVAVVPGYEKQEATISSSQLDGHLGHYRSLTSEENALVDSVWESNGNPRWIRPKHIILCETLPTLGSLGKVDRTQVVEIMSEEIWDYKQSGARTES